MTRVRRPRIAVVDAGLGNPRSCVRMLEHIEVEAFLASRPEELADSTHLILPGVGHFDEAMSRLTPPGWTEEVPRYAASGRPVLGICLGMHVLGRGSEEGSEPGLALMPWVCKRLPVMAGVRVPHMGWNTVHANGRSRLHVGGGLERFYFVHSYYVDPAEETVSAVCNYGVKIGCSVEHENVFGVQFHPEKSHRFGMALLGRFSEVDS